ncbi:MAG: GNAT family N-acetyltransferase [Dehalococcoidia bacterium]
MPWSLRAIGPDSLARYASVPSTVEVNSILVTEPLAGGLGGIRLVEQPVAVPYVKDYDAHEAPGTWHRTFDLARGWLVLAEADDTAGSVLGAAATYLESAEVATLWDIRVRPGEQRAGIGRRLLEDAAVWAREAGARWLHAETQNVNMPACRFYAGLGATLGAVDRFQYVGQPDVAHEVALHWYLDLATPPPP